MKLKCFSTVATIVFAVAEEPLRNTPVIAPARTASPSGCAVSLSANVGRLVRSVATIVVRVAIPRFLDAPSVFTGEFRFRVARARMTDGRIFVRPIATIIVSIAFPRPEDTTAGRVAFEFIFRTWNVAALFIRSVSAVVHTIAKSCGSGAVVIETLELPGFTEALFASAGLVRSVLAILFSVALPVKRNATIVFASAPMLTFSKWKMRNLK